MADKSDVPPQHAGEQSDAGPAVSELETLKANSDHLSGSLPEELANDVAKFSGDAVQLLKHHGSYQQDDRDVRRDKAVSNFEDGKWYMMMVRTVVPGGRVTAEQMLAELDLADKYGNGTVRATSRQGLQVHGVLKSDIKATVAEVNRIKLTTFAACGDVSRNVMCCPEPTADPVRKAMQDTAKQLALLMRPRTESYYTMWLRDADDIEAAKIDVTATVGGEPMKNLPAVPNADKDPGNDAVEPLYGTTYLPRKFKIGIGLPEDNCVDILTQDIGLLAVRGGDGETLEGYEVYVGGGMGQTAARKDTFPRLGDPLCFAAEGEIVELAAAIVRVQRDHGNREDRKRARMKYLIHERGLDWFRGQVEERLGRELTPPRGVAVHDVDDHLGWREQGDGKLYVGLPVPDGRIGDFEKGSPHGDGQWKSALRELLNRYGYETRITPLVGILLCGVGPGDRDDVVAILKKHRCTPAAELSLLRRNSMACVALPTCGLAVTESERVIGDVLHDIENRIAQYGLSKERIAVHMTGCPNGCSRPYTPDIGLVGKARGRYTLYLGGNVQGTRLGYIYEDMVKQEEVAATVSGPLAYFKQARENGESFGDFCARVGEDELKRYSTALRGETDTLDAEVGSLTDDQLADLIDRFADDLSAEQLRRAVTEGRDRGTNGRLKTVLDGAERRFEVAASGAGS